MEGRRCRGGTEGCHKESESLLTGTNPKPCAPLPTRARQGVGLGGGLSCTARQAYYGRLWRPLALEHLQPNSLTSTSNGLLQHRCGQLIGDCQVLGVPRCAYPAERPESLGEYVPGNKTPCYLGASQAVCTHWLSQSHHNPRRGGWHIFQN